MQDKVSSAMGSLNLTAQVKRGLLREMLQHKQVTRGQFDQLMELQRGR